jgi:hypothetical protein
MRGRTFIICSYALVVSVAGAGIEPATPAFSGFNPAIPGVF